MGEFSGKELYEYERQKMPENIKQNVINLLVKKYKFKKITDNFLEKPFISITLESFSAIARGRGTFEYDNVIFNLNITNDDEFKVFEKKIKMLMELYNEHIKFRDKMFKFIRS